MIFDTVEGAVKTLKLDRRHKWKAHFGELCYCVKYSAPCSGCDGGGCHECGYTGKRVGIYPQPAYGVDGYPVKIKARQEAERKDPNGI